MIKEIKDLEGLNHAIKYNSKMLMYAVENEREIR